MLLVLSVNLRTSSDGNLCFLPICVKQTLADVNDLSTGKYVEYLLYLAQVLASFSRYCMRQTETELGGLFVLCGSTESNGHNAI